MSDSRLKNNIKRKAMHNVIIVACGFIVLIVILLFFGANILTSFSLLVEQSQGNSNSNTSSDVQDTTFVAPPTLNPIPDATNKPQIAISGFAQKNQDVLLYINGQLVDKTSVDSDNKFQFPSVTLQAGQNTIEVKAEVGNKQSDYSDTDTISYLKNPPSLTLTSPQDGQGFSQSSSPSVGIQGQTDVGDKVTVNGAWAIVDDQGKYNYLYTLKGGDNDIKVVATDDAGNQTTKEIHIHTQ